MADFKIPGLGKKEDKPETLQDAGAKTPMAQEETAPDMEPTVMQRLAEATRAIAAAQSALNLAQEALNLIKTEALNIRQKI